MKRMILFFLTLVLLFCMITTTFAASNEAADTLHELGLFNGTGTDENGNPIYELDRAVTRHEAVTMLVRLLGKDEEAVRGTWDIPFIDVAVWAKPYVGYAYFNGLTTGTSPTTYSGNDKITTSQYLTFVLRALGYNSGTDFQWDKAWYLSDSIGITNGEYSDLTDFTRGDMVSISYHALKTFYKGTSNTLLSILYSNDVVSKDVIENVGLAKILEYKKSVLSAEEISIKCSPSVFYIEVFSKKSDYPRYPFASGSGFFISPDGVAVTCFHVIKDTEFATITTIDGNTYPITNILYADENRDIAVIRVPKNSLDGNNVSSFNYLSMQGSNTISNGSTCYAIGSPLGLENTISDGIISNNSRIVNNMSFIQITAPISSGSSGGALINKYGEVIGITSAYIEYGQNLNLVTPLDSVMSVDISQLGISYADYFNGEENSPDNLLAKTTGTNSYYKTSLKTFTAITGRECTSSFIIGGGQWYDGYVEGGHYTIDYNYEQQALDDMQKYLEYLKSSGYKEQEYGKQIDPISKEYYINVTYSNGSETIKIAYYNNFKNIRIDPPYKKFAGTVINNTLSYYNEYPRVPDAGVYLSLQLVTKLQFEDSCLYVYDASGLSTGAEIVYSFALSDSGFVFSHSDEYGNSVYMSGLLSVNAYFSESGNFVVSVRN